MKNIFLKGFLKHLFLLLVVFIPASAGDVFFKSPYILWKDAEVLIWTPDSIPAVKATEFSLSLKRNNSGIGDPTARLAGDWQRDSVAFLYSAWLKENIDEKVHAENLRARAPGMVKRLTESGDIMILFITRKGDQLYSVLFEGESAEPKAAGKIPYTADSIAMGDALAEMFFSGHAERRLTAEERKKAESRPNAYYEETEKFHGWAGIGAGFTQAKVPFTPNSWYNRKLRSRVKSYRNTQDSLSIWNFLDDESPLFSVYAGGTWYGFIGAELFLRYSQHDAKLDESDTVYKELDHWTYNRYEIGLNIHLSTTYHTTSFLDIVPYTFLGFNYSFFSEDIELKDGVKEGSNAYNTRIKFEDFYKGALLGLGSHFIFYDHYGVDLRAGIASRGRSLDREPSPDGVAEPTVIGGSTIDCFISLGLEYHWSLK